MLGHGASANVYLAEHLLLQSLRAIKRIAKSNVLYQYTLNEAHILKNLRHPNIPIIYDIEEDGQYLYIIEEYIEGESLKSYRLKQDHIQEDVIVNYSIQICELIGYLHSREQFILYLDLKPQNIIVSNNTILKLIDFGSATEKNHAEIYSLGTKGYAAPEQYTGVNIDVWSDVYGIGMLMFYLVTGEIFYDKNNCLKNIEDVGSCSKELKQIINKCLKFNPLQRYQTVHILYSKLLHISKGLYGGRCTESMISYKRHFLTISIAGSQARMGTTHTALFLTAYINKYIAKCIYREKSGHKTTQELFQSYKGSLAKGRLCQIGDCLIEPPVLGEEEKERQHIDIIVEDLGVLGKENLKKFLQGDIRILILGAKEWELNYSEKMMEELKEYKDISYLFNFLDYPMFKEVLNNMKSYRCYRMPFTANPFKAKEEEETGEMLWELLHEKDFFPKRGKKFKFLQWFSLRK